MYTANLELNMPTSDFALKHLDMAISTAKAQGHPCLKVIHGYGSSGTGGKIKSAVHKKLTSYITSSKIKGFIKGEEFSPFESSAQKWIISIPALTTDKDYLKCNQGVTVIIVK
jgi:Uncharacterized protein conserved in bacteria